MTDKRSGPYLLPGTAVRYDGLANGDPENQGGSEYGVVVHCWLDEEIQAHDCYVAFFGNTKPIGRPQKKPYILRYASLSLTVLNATSS